MANIVKDTFTRPDGALGVAETGQPWQFIRGESPMTVKANRAHVGASSIGVIHVVDTGVGGNDGTIDIDMVANDGGAQALIFRLTSASNWWRFFKRTYVQSYTFQSGTTPETYGWVGNGTYYYTPSGDFQYLSVTHVNDGSSYKVGDEYWNYDSRVGVYLNKRRFVPDATGSGGDVYSYQGRTVYENQTYQKTGGGEPIYSTGYTTVSVGRLEKCVNNILTTVREVSIPYSSTSLRVNLDGPSITCSANGSVLFSLEDRTHELAYKHGMGYAEDSSYGNTHGIEAFSAVPYNLTAYIPPVML